MAYTGNNAFPNFPGFTGTGGQGTTKAPDSSQLDQNSTGTPVPSQTTGVPYSHYPTRPSQPPAPHIPGHTSRPLYNPPTYGPPYQFQTSHEPQRAPGYPLNIHFPAQHDQRGYPSSFPYNVDPNASQIVPSSHQQSVLDYPHYPGLAQSAPPWVPRPIEPSSTDSHLLFSSVPQSSSLVELVPEINHIGPPYAPVAQGHGSVRSPTFPPSRKPRNRASSPEYHPVEYSRNRASSPVGSAPPPNAPVSTSPASTSNSATPSASASTTLGRRSQKVPQKQFSSHYEITTPSPVIWFKLPSNLDPGVPFPSIHPRCRMVGSKDPVFPEEISNTITLRISWPGYETWSKRISTQKQYGRVNRLDVAQAIVESYKAFIEEQTAHPTGELRKWSIADNGIQLSQLILVNLKQVTQGSWQAEIRVEMEG